MDTIPSVQRKSMPPDSRFSFVIILRYDPIAYSEFPAGGPGPGGAGPGPHDSGRSDWVRGSAIGIVHVVLVWRRRATTGL
jgi:hypothetical protein